MATSACRWFLAAAFWMVSALIRRAKLRSASLSLDGRRSRQQNPSWPHYSAKVLASTASVLLFFINTLAKLCEALGFTTISDTPASCSAMARLKTNKIPVASKQTMMLGSFTSFFTKRVRSAGALVNFSSWVKWLAVLSDHQNQFCQHRHQYQRNAHTWVFVSGFYRLNSDHIHIFLIMRYIKLTIQRGSFPTLA